MGMGTIYLGERLPFENKLVLIDPTGRIAMSYVKAHPVMGWEASIMRVGHGGIQVLPTADGRIGGAICFDAEFPSYIRRPASGRRSCSCCRPTNGGRSRTFIFRCTYFEPSKTACRSSAPPPS